MLEFNYKERSSKLDFKLVVDLVDCSQLFKGMISEAERVIFLIEFTK